MCRIKEFTFTQHSTTHGQYYKYVHCFLHEGLKGPSAGKAGRVFVYSILCTNSLYFSECIAVHMRRNQYKRPSCILTSTGLKIKKVDLVSVHTWHHPSYQRRNRRYVGSRREFSQVQIDRSDLHTLISAPRQNLRTVKTMKTFTQNRSDFFFWILLIST